MYIRKSDYIARFGEDAWVEKQRKQSEAHRRWCASHPETVKKYIDGYKEKNAENQKKYKAKHTDELKSKNREQCKKYYHTYSGRSRSLVHKYTQSDLEEGRGECTLTPGWIVGHIFTSSCIYCGDSDWEHLGCDRIDDSLPHTPENCVCACGICNVDRMLNEMSVEEFKKYRLEHHREV